MSGKVKATNVQQVALSKQIDPALPNWLFQASGGTQSPPDFTVDVTTAISLIHNANLPNNATYDGWFINDYAYCVSGPSAGDLRKVTGYAVVAGVATFTLGPAETGGPSDLSAVPGAGDVWAVAAALPATMTSDLQVEPLPREYATLTFDKPESVPGLKSCSCSLELDFAGLETVRDSAQAATPAAADRFAKLLEGIGTRIQGEGVLTHAVEVSTASRIYLAAPGGFVADNIPAAGKSNTLMINGVMRKITAIGSAPADYVDVTPDLPAAAIPDPASPVECYAPETTIPSEEGQVRFTILHLLDDQLRELIGVAISLSASLAYGALAKVSVDGVGHDWNVRDPMSWDNIQSEKSPVVAVEGSGFFAPLLGTAYTGSPLALPASLPFTEVSFDLGVERPVHKISSGHRARVTDRNSTLSATVANESSAVKDGSLFSQLQGQRGFVFVQCGITAGAAFGVLAYAQIENVQDAEVDGVAHWTVSLKHTDGDQSSTARKMLIVRF